jgi:hypothetical protein
MDALLAAVLNFLVVMNKRERTKKEKGQRRRRGWTPGPQEDISPEGA